MVQRLRVAGELSGERGQGDRRGGGWPGFEVLKNADGLSKHRCPQRAHVVLISQPRERAVPPLIVEPRAVPRARLVQRAGLGVRDQSGAGGGQGRGPGGPVAQRAAEGGQDGFQTEPRAAADRGIEIGQRHAQAFSPGRLVDACDADDRLPLGVVRLRDADPPGQGTPGPFQGLAGSGQQPPVFRAAIAVHAGATTVHTRRTGAHTRRAAANSRRAAGHSASSSPSSSSSPATFIASTSPTSAGPRSCR